MAFKYEIGDEVRIKGQSKVMTVEYRRSITSFVCNESYDCYYENNNGDMKIKKEIPENSLERI